MRNCKDGMHGIDMCAIVEHGRFRVWSGLLLDSTPRQGTSELAVFLCAAVAMEVLSRAETGKRVACVI